MPKTHRHMTRRSVRALSPRAARFVAEYLKDFKAAKAAIRAGYSRAGAASRASELLRNLTVRKTIDEANQRIFRSTQASVSRITQRLAQLAFFDTAHLFDENGDLRAIKDLPPDARGALASVHLLERSENGARRVHFGGQLLALIALAKHYAMFSRRLAADPDYVPPPDLVPRSEEEEKMEPEGEEGDDHLEKIPISAFHDAIDEVERLKLLGDPEALAADEDEDDDGD